MVSIFDFWNEDYNRCNETNILIIAVIIEIRIFNIGIVIEIKIITLGWNKYYNFSINYRSQGFQYGYCYLIIRNITSWIKDCKENEIEKKVGLEDQYEGPVGGVAHTSSHCLLSPLWGQRKRVQLASMAPFFSEGCVLGLLSYALKPQPSDQKCARPPPPGTFLSVPWCNWSSV